MSGPVRDTGAMIAGMAPARVPGTFVFRTARDADDLAASLPGAVAMMRETEGVSLIVPAPDDAPLAMAQITLTVASALDGVGLTAAVSGALAGAGIPCNMVAGHHHDHLFVPAAMAERALEILHGLAAGGAAQDTDRIPT